MSSDKKYGTTFALIKHILFAGKGKPSMRAKKTLLKQLKAVRPSSAGQWIGELKSGKKITVPPDIAEIFLDEERVGSSLKRPLITQKNSNFSTAEMKYAALFIGKAENPTKKCYFILTAQLFTPFQFCFPSAWEESN